jgi:Ni/Co efflux regulator RcnB
MKRILTALLALTTLAAPVVASADDKGRGHKKGHDKHERHDRDWDDRDDRRDERRAYRQGFRDGRGYDRGYVHVQPRYWNRGQYLPQDFRRAVIYDPYRYGLYAPPRGHAWMHVGNDVYLTQLGSGLIVQVLRDSYH